MTPKDTGFFDEVVTIKYNSINNQAVKVKINTMKRIIGIILIAVAAVTAGWNFSQSQNEVKLSDLALANIEALASGEFNEGTCRYSQDGSTGMCNIRKDHALELYYSFGGHWCCDSCSSTRYCG